MFGNGKQDSRPVAWVELERFVIELGAFDSVTRYLFSPLWLAGASALLSLNDPS